MNSHDADTTGPSFPGGPQLTLAAPPQRGWLTFRRTFDTILSRYLVESLQSIRGAFDDYRDSVDELPGRTQLVTLDEHLGLCLDLLTTAPSLSPPRTEFRPDRHQVVELLARLQQATDRVVEFTASTEQLRGLEPGSSDWNQACTGLVELLARVEEPLRQRRELR